MKSIKEKFFDLKRDKAFYKVLKKWFSGISYSSDTISVNLCSMLTHCLIEVTGKDNEEEKKAYYEALEILEQSNLLNKFISGQISDKEVKEIYEDKFGQYIF